MARRLNLEGPSPRGFQKTETCANRCCETSKEDGSRFNGKEVGNRFKVQTTIYIRLAEYII